MAKKAELKAVLSLDNSKFIRGIKAGIEAAKRLAQQFKKNPIQTTFLAGALAASAGIKATSAGLQKMASVGIKAFKGIAVGATLAAGAITFLGVKAVNAAADMEDFTTSFEVLLGTAEKARARMTELATFANNTPYDLDEVASASQQLEILTKGALSSGKGLRLVGDVASGTRKSFEDTATTIGKLYSALRSGTSPADALESLKGAGALDPKEVRRISGLAAAGDGVGAWKEAQKGLARFDGMMDKKARGWHGLMSTFRGIVKSSFAELGKPIMNNLKPMLDLATKSLMAMGPSLATMGTSFASGIKTGIGFLYEAFSNPEVIVAPLVAVFQAGILGVGAMISGIFEGDFVAGATRAFAGLGSVIFGTLMKSFSGAVAYLQDAIEFVFEAIPIKFKNFFDYSDGTARTFKQLQEDNKGKAREFGFETIGLGKDKTASEKTEDGKKAIVDGTSEAITSAVETFKAQAQLDASGAGKKLREALESITASAGKGSSKLNDLADDLRSKTIATAQQKEERDAKYGPMAKFDTVGTLGSRLKSSGLTSGSNDTGSYTDTSTGKFVRGGAKLDMENSKRVTPLLKLRERREFENATVAGQQAVGDKNARRGSSPNSFGAVRRGDRQRMQEVQRERLREKSGLDKTNSILTSLESKFDQAWNQTK